MESYSRIIDTFKKIFIATMSFLFILAAFIGWFMARRAISGVEIIARTARQISEGSFDKRVPVKTKGDEIDQLASTFNQMLDRIQTLVREIKEMSDNIAHDLKSPITRIRGIAEVNLTTRASLKDYETMTASIIEECDSLLDMVNTMLIISQTEAGIDTMETVVINLKDVIRNACDLFTPMAEEKNITLTCKSVEKLNIDGDIRMIQRMIANLIDNAIKYTPRKGMVDVSAGMDERQSIVISIKDKGIGISESDIPHIFKRFYRCDPSRSESGIGLGLSLAEAIAHAHGGRISVSSSPDKGSTFTVTIPFLS